MRTNLQNELLSVDINSRGAEMASIRSRANGCEYLWQRHPAFWMDQAPISFPIVGAVRNRHYTYDGQSYEMNNHGFAKEMEFTLLSSTTDKAVYRLTENEASLKIYPFKFMLDVTYKLVGNAIEISYNVTNTDDKAIYFSLGNHAGFNCPLEQGSKYSDWYLEFDQPETLEREFIGADGMLESFTEKVLNNSSIIPMTDDMFNRSGWVLQGFRSRSITLRSKKSTRSVTLDLPGWPGLSLWGNGAFVCIQPWNGLSDVRANIVDLPQKKGIISLDPGKIYGCKYSFIIE